MKRRVSIQAAFAAAVVGAIVLVTPAAAPAAAAFVSDLPSSPGEQTGPFEVWEAKSARCLDDTGGSTANNVQLEIYRCTNVSNERWFIEYPPDGDIRGFWLVNQKSSKCMTVQGAVSDNYKPIIQYTCGYGTNEKWGMGPADTNGHLSTMTAVNSGKCATVKGDPTADKTPIQQYTCGGSAGDDNQIWFFYHV